MKSSIFWACYYTAAAFVGIGLGKLLAYFGIAGFY